MPQRSHPPLHACILCSPLLGRLLVHQKGVRELLSFLKQELSGSVDGFWLSSLQYMVFAGEFLGCFLWGPLADRIGRRWAFLFANAGLTIFGLASAFAPTFVWLVVFRFLV